MQYYQNSMKYVKLLLISVILTAISASFMPDIMKSMLSGNSGAMLMQQKLIEQQLKQMSANGEIDPEALQAELNKRLSEQQNIMQQQGMQQGYPEQYEQNQQEMQEQYQEQNQQVIQQSQQQAQIDLITQNLQSLTTDQLEQLKQSLMEQYPGQYQNVIQMIDARINEQRQSETLLQNQGANEYQNPQPIESMPQEFRQPQENFEIQQE